MLVIILGLTLSVLDSSIVNLHNWSQGSFSGMTWGNVRTAALVVLPALAAAFCLAKPMAAYQMGEAYARSVGVDVRRFSRSCPADRASSTLWDRKRVQRFPA